MPRPEASYRDFRRHEMDVVFLPKALSPFLNIFPIEVLLFARPEFAQDQTINAQRECCRELNDTWDMLRFPKRANFNFPFAEEDVFPNIAPCVTPDNAE